MATSEQARLIGQLKRGGMTQSQIARQLGRDQSLVSQAARGVGNKGASLVPALRQLASTGRVTTPPPRRMVAPAARGEPPRPARVRQPVIETPAGIHLEQRAAGTGRVIRRELQQASGKVQLRVTDREGHQFTIFKHGGRDAQSAWLDIRQNGGDVFGTVATWIAEGMGSGTAADDMVGDPADWTLEIDTAGGFE